ncbi:MAG TPA: Asp-tRNA(Asn)/Glu-tRNA(Gln) amidotransferase GatCAB subunit A, partial [Marinobacter hydrocarbonoclasticus]|nr:Asp-tRNA(Asn)/Glu-tRNA(Gln) amidotransferase GatCAB subunit A [Marinobacter nauticus]
MHNKSVAELSRELESGRISSVELTQQFLDRLKTEDGKYNSFITISEEQALAEARAADEMR